MDAADAHDWLVLTQLTHNNATAVGMVMALQFGPHILLLRLRIEAGRIRFCINDGEP